MSEWAWVVLGYVIAYSSLGGYLVSLARRRVRVRRQQAAVQSRESR
jgi:hypothetical protein